MRNSQPEQPQPPLPKPQPISSVSIRSIADLEKLIEDFLRNIEGALHTPYELASAQKDYEMIIVALAKVERGMEERNMLHVTEMDKMRVNDENGQTADQLLQRALVEKTNADTDFQKIATAASAAKDRSEA